MADAVLDALRKACDEHAHPADDDDAVGGIPAGYVATPATTDQVADTMRVAAEHGLAVVVRGHGTKLDWGNPPSALDLLLDTTRLADVVEHAAGDLVVHGQAGVPLHTLQARVAEAGQRLAVDAPHAETPAGATVGGTVATGASGPRRLVYGGVRDLLIGATVVRADGMVARTGGKVVKNVAGYDLGKLYTGSFGTLGVLTECLFRLHPLPAASAVVSMSSADLAGLAEQAAAVRSSQLVPTAVELDWPAPDSPATLAVLLEGVPAGVEARAGIVAGLLGDGAQTAAEPPSWWGTLPERGTTVKVTFAVSGLGAVLAALRRAGESAGLQPVVRGQAGSGVLWVGVDGDAEPGAVGAYVADLRRAVEPHDGTAVVLRAPAAARAAVGDCWGPVRGLELMRRVKDQFDPEHRLAPGRFVGGI